MSNRHCWKTEKEVEALSVYIDAGPPPVLERRKGGGGMEVVDLRHRPNGRAGGGSCHGQSSPTLRAHPRPTSPSSQPITTLACMSPNRRRAAAA
jgi:hypothetical protein